MHAKGEVLTWVFLVKNTSHNWSARFLISSEKLFSKKLESVILSIIFLTTDQNLIGWNKGLQSFCCRNKTLLQNFWLFKDFRKIDKCSYLNCKMLLILKHWNPEMAKPILNNTLQDYKLCASLCSQWQSWSWRQRTMRTPVRNKLPSGWQKNE